MDQGPGMYTLGGAALGAFMAFALLWFKEHLREQARKKTESYYLAVVVIGHLEDYARRCLRVSRDDGRDEEGNGAGRDDSLDITEDPPTIAPLEMGVEWKSLNLDLMRRCLELPRRADKISRWASSAIEDEGYNREFFWRRQEGFAAFGLDVMILIADLQRHAGLPDDVTQSNKILVNNLQRVLVDIKESRRRADERRVERDKRNASRSSLPPDQL